MSAWEPRGAAMTEMFWILDGHEVKSVSDVEIWAATGGVKHVDDTDIGDARISTVFLGIDHSHGHGPPLLFETMIFGGVHDQYQVRCSTWEQAEAQHATACAMVRKYIN